MECKKCNKEIALYDGFCRKCYNKLMDKMPSEPKLKTLKDLEFIDCVEDRFNGKGMEIRYGEIQNKLRKEAEKWIIVPAGDITWDGYTIEEVHAIKKWIKHFFNL